MNAAQIFPCPMGEREGLECVKNSREFSGSSLSMVTNSPQNQL